MSGDSLKAQLGTLRAAIVRALDALEDGDTEQAAAFLRSALHRKAPSRYRCGRCGLGFAWPGDLDLHLALTSCGDEAAA